MDRAIDLPAAHLPEKAMTRTEGWSLRLVLMFTLAGAIIAAYLVRLHAAIDGNPKRGLCTFNDTISCDKVLASPYAEIAGVPVAAIGLLGFALLFVLAAWRLLAGEGSPRWLPAGLVLTAGIGLAFELGMTWVEFFIIRAVCPYCLTAFGLIAGTFVASVVTWRASRTNTRREGRHA